MKILVTGGAGFIGSNVVDGYVADGHEVVVVDNLHTGRRGNLNPAARFYETDVRSDGIDSIFESERPDVLNHHAAQMSVPASVEDPRFDADVNIMGLLNLLESAVRTGVGKVIFASTGGAVYGDASSSPTPEDYPPRPMSPYAVTKLASEHYLNYYRAEHGLESTVLRYANVYGPRQVPHGEAGVVAIFMEKLSKGELPTIYHFDDDPDGMTRDYCYVGDVVKANLLALKNGQGETLNIATGVGTKTAMLYRLILDAMRKRGHALGPEFDDPPRGPARPGDLKRSCLDAGRAARVLGFRATTDLQSGIERTLEWLLGGKDIMS